VTSKSIAMFCERRFE